MNAAAEILRAAEHVEDALDALRRALAKLDADAYQDIADLERAIRWANGCPISLRSLARCVEETAA